MSFFGKIFGSRERKYGEKNRKMKRSKSLVKKRKTKNNYKVESKSC